MKLGRSAIGWHARWLVLAWVGIVATACGPGGPSYDELTTQAEFAATAPGVIEVGAGGSNSASGIEGWTYAFATRTLVSTNDAASVLAWHRELIEKSGWQRANFAFIAMGDGHVPEHAWRRGDLVIGLGFPDRERVEDLGQVYPAGTLYTVTITFQPEDG